MATHRTRKNGVIIIKTIIPIEKENGVILNGKKERVPDGDTLCWLRCGANSGCNATVLRTGQLKLGELKAARAVSDVAYAAVVMFTNAYALLNPDREEAVVLVKRMQEDLEYFRRYAMPDPNRSRDTKPDGDDEPQPATPAE